MTSIEFILSTKDYLQDFSTRYTYNSNAIEGSTLTQAETYAIIYNDNSFKIDNINSNLLDIFINSIIVIILYLITYLTIDKRTIEKSKNKKDVYKQILINMYSECIQTLNLIHDENILNKIIKQVDGNAPIIENKIVNNLMNLPFENKDTILDFAKSGEIDVNTFQRFLNIQSDYRKYINMLIICFNRQEYIETLKVELLKKLNKEVELLK